MKRNDAIPTDVSNPQDKEMPGSEPEPVLSERELAMQEIEDQLSAQSGAAAEPDPDPAPAQPQDSAPSALPEILAEDQLDKVKVKVKVDGQVVEMPLSEVTKGYQKDAVASRRLALAAEERKALEQRQRELEEREKKLTAPVTPSPEDDDGDVDAQIAAAMSALVEGDEEAATQALKSVLKGRREKGSATPVIDEEAILSKAEQRIAQKNEEAERSKAWTEFVESNPDFADETSKQRQYGDYLFVSKYAPQIEAGELSYREALNQAAEEVASVFKTEPAPAPSNPREEKKQRKAAIDNLPTAGARAVRQPEPEQTTEDVLAEMRQMRGQPV